MHQMASAMYLSSTCTSVGPIESDEVLMMDKNCCRVGKILNC